MHTEDTFNPEQFQNLVVEDAFETEFTNIPEGDYIAMTSPVTNDSYKRFLIKNGPNAGSYFYRLDLEWTPNDEDGSLKEALGFVPKVRQGIRLDMTKDGTLETGKNRNIELGQVRKAFGQNEKGKRWSFSSLGNQVARITVKHRIDGDKTYVDVKGVSAV